MSTVLEIRDLKIGLKKDGLIIPAVNGVSFALQEKKTFGIIGESGSGKSLTCMAAMGLLDKKRWQVSGDIILKGERIPYEDNAAMGRFRGNRIALIMQSPMSAFDPTVTIEHHFRETVNKAGQNKMAKEDIRKKASEMLLRMRIRDPEAVLRNYSFQLSGGMLQRIMITLALIMEPDVLIADEPTTALDMTTQHEIINLLEEIQKELGTAILLVSHDLGVISHLASEVAVMYAGSIVEKGPLDNIIGAPLHPYSKGLFLSRPAFSKKRLPVLNGQPPTLTERGEGCQFYKRCMIRRPECLEHSPEMVAVAAGHEVSCRYCLGDKPLEDNYIDVNNLEKEYQNGEEKNIHAIA